MESRRDARAGSSRSRQGSSDLIQQLALARKERLERSQCRISEDPLPKSEAWSHEDKENSAMEAASESSAVAKARVAPRPKPSSSAVDSLTARLGGLGFAPSHTSPAVAEVMELSTDITRKGSGRMVHSSAVAIISDSDSEDDWQADGPQPKTADVSKGLQMPEKVEAMLYPHQKEGVEWLWHLHGLRRGGILADDMGLGKTMQVAAFLSGMFKMKLVRRVMVVAPKTLLEHWAKELRTCGLASKTHQYFGGSQADRRNALQSVMSSPGVLLTTYGMVLHNSEALAGGTAARSRHCEDDEDDSSKFAWDFMILDEGHKVKNPKMQLVQRLNDIACKSRIIISGTPIQNNLMEFHALLDFACPGLLGDRRTFKRVFEIPISAGSDRTASHREREIGAATSAKLRATTGPYILRREKKDVLPGKDATLGSKGAEGSGVGSETGGAPAGPRPQAMGRKNDFIIWLRLAPTQRRVYEAFLNSEPVKAVLNQTRSALAAITVLKKVCDHPALLSNQAADLIVSGGNKLANRRGGADSDSDSEDDFVSCSSHGDGSSSDEEFEVKSKHRPSLDREGAKEHPQGTEDNLEGADWWRWASEDIQAQLMDALARRGAEASCKTTFAMSLLKKHMQEGHRTLVFSQSRVMLDILQAELSELRVKFLRIDGGVSAHERQELVARYQTRSDIPVFLLTSQVGGLGLTLTAADRVIIVDPAWNPSTDNQSVDRAYRIGQSKDVVVYRLITCGTVEEKIYRNQVYKGGISRAGMADGNHFRYFSHQDLRDLFSAVPEELMASKTQKQLHDLHAAQRVASEELKAHLQWLETLQMFAGVSDHDLIYSKESADGFRHSSKSAQPAPSQWQPAAAGRTGIKGRPRPPKQVPQWGGAGELSDKFASALRLHLPDPAQAAIHSAQTKVTQLEKDLASQRALGARINPSSLPDGGAKLRSSVQSLEQELSKAKSTLVAANSNSGSEASVSAAEGHGEVVQSQRAPSPPRPPPQAVAGPGQTGGLPLSQDPEAFDKQSKAEVQAMKQELIQLDARLKATDGRGAEAGQIKSRIDALLPRYRKSKAAHLKWQLCRCDEMMKGQIPIPHGMDRSQLKSQARALSSEYQAAKAQLQRAARS